MNNVAASSTSPNARLTPAANGAAANNLTGGRELICVVRPGNGGGQEQVIVIKRPSESLLSRIAEEHQSQSGAFFTSGRVEQGDDVPLVPIQR